MRTNRVANKRDGGQCSYSWSPHWHTCVGGAARDYDDDHKMNKMTAKPQPHFRTFQTRRQRGKTVENGFSAVTNIVNDEAGHHHGRGGVEHSPVDQHARLRGLGRKLHADADVGGAVAGAQEAGGRVVSAGGGGEGCVGEEEIARIWGFWRGTNETFSNKKAQKRTGRIAPMY